MYKNKRILSILLIMVVFFSQGSFGLEAAYGEAVKEPAYEKEREVTSEKELILALLDKDIDHIKIKNDLELDRKNMDINEFMEAIHKESNLRELFVEVLLGKLRNNSSYEKLIEEFYDGSKDYFALTDEDYRQIGKNIDKAIENGLEEFKKILIKHDEEMKLYREMEEAILSRTINKGLKISGLEGERVTLYACDGDRHFYIGENTGHSQVIFENLIFKKEGETGGGIQTLPREIFEYSGYKAKNIVLDSCDFIENKFDLGGAIYHYGDILIKGDSAFIGNKSQKGGAILTIDPNRTYTSEDFSPSHIKLKGNVEFKENSSLTDGGAIYMENGSLESSGDIKFMGNRAVDGDGGKGGAIYLGLEEADLLYGGPGPEKDYGSQNLLKMEGSHSFKGNESKEEAGAIYMGSGRLVGLGAIEFLENKASRGGAISFNLDELYTKRYAWLDFENVDGVLFKDNVGASGDDIALNQDVEAILNNCSLYSREGTESTIELVTQNRIKRYSNPVGRKLTADDLLDKNEKRKLTIRNSNIEGFRNFIANKVSYKKNLKVPEYKVDIRDNRLQSSKGNLVYNKTEEGEEFKNTSIFEFGGNYLDVDEFSIRGNKLGELDCKFYNNSLVGNSLDLKESSGNLAHNSFKYSGEIELSKDSKLFNNILIGTSVKSGGESIETSLKDYEGARILYEKEDSLEVLARASINKDIHEKILEDYTGELSPKLELMDDRLKEYERPYEDILAETYKLYSVHTVREIKDQYDKYLNTIEDSLEKLEEGGRSKEELEIIRNKNLLTLNYHAIGSVRNILEYLKYNEGFDKYFEEDVGLDNPLMKILAESEDFINEILRREDMEGLEVLDRERERIENGDYNYALDEKISSRNIVVSPDDKEVLARLIEDEGRELGKLGYNKEASRKYFKPVENSIAVGFKGLGLGELQKDKLGVERGDIVTMGPVEGSRDEDEPIDDRPTKPRPPLAGEKFRLTLYGNAGKFETGLDKVVLLEGDRLPGVSREGYKLVGWSDKKDGDIKKSSKELEDMLKNLKSNEEYYAVWTKETLDKLNHFAYIKGYDDNTIRPEEYITREEVAVVFYRLLDKDFKNKIQTDRNSFKDIEKGRWSNVEISSLSNGKIIEGYRDGSFKPGDKIRRAEVAAIASRFDNLSGGENKFSDIDGHWAKDYIISSADKGWIKGYEDGSFRPDEYILRSEFVALVNGVLNRKVKKENIPEGIVEFDDLPEDKWYYEDMVEASNGHDYIILEDSSEKWLKLNKRFFQ